MQKADLLTKNHFELQAWQQGKLVCGIDEVGRGCLAGPVVACALILPIGTAPDFLQDSKTMTARQRERAAAWIQTECRYAFGIVNHRTIDSHNIYQSTLMAMKKAVVNLLSSSTEPATIVVDAMPLSMQNTCYSSIPVHYFCKGEMLSSSIAAASIMAKVYRDDLMSKANIIFPGYFFDVHKGYGTAKHQQAIKTNAQSLIHRCSFLKKSVILSASDSKPAPYQTLEAQMHKNHTGGDDAAQQSLC